MKHSAAIALAIAALLAADAANACSLFPLEATFRTSPVAYEAEVTKVRRIWWPDRSQRRLGRVYEAEFRLIGPVRPRVVPIYRWDRNDDCDPAYPVKRGQHVWLLLERDPVAARQSYIDMLASSEEAGDPLSPLPALSPDDYLEEVIVYPYTNDLSKVQEILEDYRPIL
ncbi:MAG: hypothetical protein ACRED4_05275 [Brevundimonas sp.]